MLDGEPCLKSLGSKLGGLTPTINDTKFLSLDVLNENAHRGMFIAYKLLELGEDM